jgi:putative DNA primase/helicase
MTKLVEVVDSPIVDRRFDLKHLLHSKDGIRGTYGNCCLLIRFNFKERFRWDKMALRPVLDGIPCSDVRISEIREYLEQRHEAVFSLEMVQQAVAQVASERSFHPVRQFLEELPSWDGVPRISRVLTDILYAQDTLLNQAYIRSFFIAAVTRVARPGAKFDNVLVLHGDQGTLKSTFFSKLAAPWFADTYFDIKQRQAYLTLAAAWIYELAEIESVVGTREDSDVKRFLSSAVDTFTPPYGKAAVQHPRSTIFVGTTNEDAIFKDPSGNRRYWVIHVPRRINIALIEAWRTQLWAEALHMFYDDVPYWLDEAAEADQAEANRAFTQVHPWHSQISKWLSQDWHFKERNHTVDIDQALTTSRILQSACELPIGHHHKSEEMVVAAIMRDLGYRKSRQYCGPKKIRLWVWLKRDVTTPEVLDAMP